MVCLQLKLQTALMIQDAPIPFSRELFHADPERAVCRFPCPVLLRLLETDELNHEGRDVSYLPDMAGFAHHFAAF
jgi:hypothetical protein